MNSQTFLEFTIKRLIDYTIKNILTQLYRHLNLFGVLLEISLSLQIIFNFQLTYNNINASIKKIKEGGYVMKSIVLSEVVDS